MKPLLKVLAATALLAGASLRPTSAVAQTLNISNANPILVCPNRPYVYAGTLTTTTGNDDQCRYYQTATGGVIQQSQQNFRQMSVTWGDVPAGKVTLRLEFNGGCTTTANNAAPFITRDYFIRSVTNLQMGAITFNGASTASLDFGSTDPVTLEVPYLRIPRHVDEPNPVTQFAEGYEWTIPAGWSWPDGTVSNGAPRLFESRTTSGPTASL